MGKSNLIKIAALLLVMALAIIALIPEQSTDNNLSGKEKTQQILVDDAGKQMLGRKGGCKRKLVDTISMVCSEIFVKVYCDVATQNEK